MESAKTYPRCKIKLVIPEIVSSGGMKPIANPSPEEVVAIAMALSQSLKDPPGRTAWGENAITVGLRSK